MSDSDHRVSRSPTFITWLLVIGAITGSAILLSSIWLKPNGPQEEQSILTPISLQNAAVVLSAYETSPQTKLKTLKDRFIDQPAPDFSLPTLDGGDITLSDFQGQPVLLNFWASWCLPCRDEMPALMAAYKRYKDRGFVVLGVNFTEQDTLPEIETFVKTYEISYPVVLDDPGHVTVDLYGMLGLPMSIFVSRQGIVKRVIIGPMAETEIDHYITEILKEK